MAENAKSSGLWLALAGVALALGGAAGGWLWQSHRQSAASKVAVSSTDKAAIEKVVHDYILEHPEILPEAVERLKRNEDARQLSGIADAVETPFPGAVLGNPQGRITLVEFTDFACTFCRKSVEDVDALIAANPDLRVVVREWPILSPASDDAARMGLAAAEQGKYAQFHHAMFEIGHPDAANIAAAGAASGLDMDRARRIGADPAISAEVARNLDFARKLGFTGTPSWVIGDQMMAGAVGKEVLARAIAAARE